MMSCNELPYSRILLKLSGEALAGKDGQGINPDAAEFIAKKIQPIYQMGIQVAVVIGAGNIWRGQQGVDRGMDQTTADHMGMIATVINGLALQDALERLSIPTRVQTAIEMNKVAEPYIRLRAIRHLDKARVVILAGGTGNPRFTTDTAGALRAAEIEANILIKATQVNGVYSADPKKFPDATRFEKISYQEVIEKELKVMDLTAFTFCKEYNIPILVVDFWAEDDLTRAVQGDNSVGTLISS
jgi:uridylate kinase